MILVLKQLFCYKNIVRKSEPLPLINHCEKVALLSEHFKSNILNYKCYIVHPFMILRKIFDLETFDNFYLRGILFLMSAAVVFSTKMMVNYFIKIPICLKLNIAIKK